MKLQIRIIGPRVHDVGYRPFLIELAMKMALRGFEVFNDEEEGQQVVITLVEGDDRRIKQFFKFATVERPPLALVNNVTSAEYVGDVMPMWQAASINTAEQINKAVPILKSVEENTNAILENTNIIIENTKPIRKIESNTDAILEEVKGLREDIQPGFASRFQQVQADVKAIKARLGMS